jgi:hypothetical protein
MSWLIKFKLWFIRRWARGIARAQKRCYDTARIRFPDRSEQELLRIVLRSRSGYSEVDVEKMASQCKTIYDLCMWIITKEYLDIGFGIPVVIIVHDAVIDVLLSKK